jgi:hypothetical protein
VLRVALGEAEGVSESLGTGVGVAVSVEV